MLYGACYYPEHREAHRWEEDLQLMREAGINALRITEFAWKSMEPSEGIYDFEWLDEFIRLADNYAIQIVLCPPMRTVPAWLVEMDRTVLILTQEGHRLEYASRYTFCVNHPLLREKASRLASAMATQYGRLPSVIGWHLDNEIGDEPDCHCPVCLAKWRSWLKRKYEGIDALNTAWGTVFWGQTFDRFEQIATPRLTKADYNPAYIQAWRQFRSDCNVNAARLLAEAVRPHIQDTKQYVTTNNQMLWNNRTDYYEMAKLLDITGTNYYPPFGDRCRSIELGLAVNRSLKKAPFHVYELRNEGHAILGAEGNTPAPGELERLVLHTIANGADGVFFFPWKRFPFGSEQNHGAITDFDGQPTRIYDECQALGKRLHRISQSIEGSQVVSEIAVLYDFPSRWHIEHPSAWTGNPNVYVQHINKLYHSVRKLGYNCDAVGRHGDFTAYKLLLVPMLPIVDDGLVLKLQQYAESGGVIVFHPLIGIKNEEASYYNERLHPGIIQLLGSKPLEAATSGAQTRVQFSWRDRLYEGDMLHELVQAESAQVAGAFASQWYEGFPAVTVQPVGNGHSWFIATFAEERFYLDFLEERCRELRIPTLLGTMPPAHIETTMRQHADGTRYVFVLNGSSDTAAMKLDRQMYDVWNDEWLEGELLLKPYGVRVLIERT
ncbi:beta-galactosidase [Paenibacillus sp. LHD-38]|uniref:beta-galactosidase n=1 Tax=Paenibacillus sp. LHD-38 TaxID=3072143 RepID=UPI002810020D|nr:beta-galactosidase [Paenibacillus sp. LHD-38]MDQ8737161.1 beta-galactosidase [Paenibacillus sp. LHD-38]